MTYIVWAACAVILAFSLYVTVALACDVLTMPVADLEDDPR